MPRFPALDHRSVGIGLDLHWGQPVGLGRRDDGTEGPSDVLQAFYRRYGDQLGHSFVSWQPRS